MRGTLAILLILSAACVSPAEEPAPKPPPKPVADAATYSFEGRVVSDLEEPVTVVVAALRDWHSSKEAQRFSATVAPGGTFRFEGLKKDRYGVGAQSPSSALFGIDEILVAADVRDIEIHVRRACRVVARVKLATGIDRENCRVNWTRGNSTTDIGQLAADDRFTLERLEPGPIEVTIAHFPDRKGPQASLRGYAVVETTLKPGDNAVEIRVAPETIRRER